MAEIAPEKHAGGRPPIYDGNNEDDVKKVSELCESYFKQLPVSKPPTVTGLTLHLGFENKSSLYDYAKKDEFSNSIKRALTQIEMFHEEATAMGDKCTGNIFVLKNFNWKDTVQTEHSGKIGGMNKTTVVFKKYNDGKSGD